MNHLITIAIRRKIPCIYTKSLLHRSKIFFEISYFIVQLTVGLTLGSVKVGLANANIIEAGASVEARRRPRTQTQLTLTPKICTIKI